MVLQWAVFKLLTFTAIVVEGGIPEVLGYQAALIVDGRQFCSGGLISTRHVITQANCVFKASEVDVTFDVENLYEMGKIYISRSILVHENFTRVEDYSYDVALVELPVDVGGKQTALQLDRENVSLESLTLSGFNSERLGSQEVHVDEDKCQDFSLCINGEQYFSAVVPTVESCEVAKKSWNQGSPVVGQDGRNLVGFGVQIGEECILIIKINHLIEWIDKIIPQGML